MSGWGGAQERPENREVELRLTEEYQLTDEQKSVVGQILHTMTFRGTYSTREVEERVRVLLDAGRPVKKRYEVRGPFGSPGPGRWTVVDTRDRDVAVDHCRTKSDANASARELNQTKVDAV
jgi:hypothetical protein